jgi:hypothetical protein
MRTPEAGESLRMLSTTQSANFDFSTDPFKKKRFRFESVPHALHRQHDAIAAGIA